MALDNPAVLYLCKHEGLKALKIGIGSTSNRRLTQHNNHCWITVLLLRTSRIAALDIEKEVLRWWRKDLALPPFLSANEMPQLGNTETVALDAVSVYDTIDLIQTLAFPYL